MKIVLLDTTPLGLLSHPTSTKRVADCRAWATSITAAGGRIIIPEIADYEIRRELLRANKVAGLAILDGLAAGPYEYLPITTAVMRQAAVLWANARTIGQPTASDDALDGDVILAAQALSLGVPVIVATANVAHISRYVPADDWTNITP